MKPTCPKRSLWWWTALVVWVFSWLPCCSAAAAVTAQAVAERNAVYVGEPFQFQIRVSNAQQPEAPDLSSLTDFTVEPLGGQNYNSESVNTVNGRTARVVDRGYAFSYQLTPKREGRLAIPAIAVIADGQRVRTQPVTITVRKPEVVDDFKLRMEVSKSDCYVGEPLLLEIVWYLGQPVQGGRFTLPSAESFQLFDPYADSKPGNLVEVAAGNSVVKAEEGQGTLEGKSYRTLRFRRALVPKREGAITIEPATVAFEVPLGEPNNFPPRFGPVTRGLALPPFAGPRGFGSYRRVIIPSNALKLTARSLPNTGRPLNFSGPIGHYETSASASPTQVNLGDPITLTMKLTGSPGLDHVLLPPLNEQPAFSNDFKIPTDMGTGKAAGAVKVFTQTIRALRADVKEIPPIELPFFDTVSASYQVARSQPIPLQVSSVKVVTATDGEGRTRAPVAGSPNAGTQHPRPLVRLISPFWFCVMLVLPLSLLVGLVLRLPRRRNPNPRVIPSGHAYGKFSAALKAVSWEESRSGSDAVLNALRIYLGAKLGMITGALTFKDVAQPLHSKGVPAETIKTLQTVFRRCEASRYGGLPPASDPDDLVGQCQEIVAEIEQVLR